MSLSHSYSAPEYHTIISSVAHAIKNALWTHCMVNLSSMWAIILHHSEYRIFRTTSFLILRFPYYCLWTSIDLLAWKMHAVHALQVEIGELKGRLTEVISNCDALCKRIASEGPESLRSSVKPFAIATADSEISCSSSTLPRDLNKISPSTEANLE